ncbi:uncharacterized protein K460DRAFT_403889 [Cucurbitaria berberidis CBS 394.84]|uniref:Uncharacterized protein n=1 Tax=Cucurbitaria berberidis CBS 394.84 TaxID=1168544 RepID=A0A9P4GNV0_9PLEO|nr:uncharacterized protein K460DRAFT_403889 [Cucurbitaria berberidis CBS 394.84]KAF1848607.1 hypothetical protein K460DRAFT_403889 [Cucurbitaria berberidis CBS 394.84]
MSSAQLRKGIQPTLLTLPGEIRNRICQYALSCEMLRLALPVVGTSPPSPLLDSRLAVPRPILIDAAVQDLTKVIEFNQVKFACRQLYAETAGVELKYNHLLITRRWNFEDSVCEQFLQLAKHVQAKLHWLAASTVLLADVRPHILTELRKDISITTYPISANMVTKVASWCKDHLSVQVHIVLPGFRPSNGDMLDPVSFTGDRESLLITLADILVGKHIRIILPPGSRSRCPEAARDFMTSWGL